MRLKKNKKSWLVFQWRPELPLGVRWHHQIDANTFVQGESAANLPPASDVEVLLILPGQAVTLHALTLASRRREALAWQLEPLLLCEMPEIHCVALAHQGERHLVATIARDRLQACVERLRELGYEARRALPATLLLNENSLMPEGDMLHVRLADGAGMTLHREQWSALSTLHPPLREIKPQPEMTLAQLAAAAITRRYNLLQHDFRPRQPGARGLSLTALAAAAVIFALLAEPLWQGVQYQRQAQQLAAQLQARYRHYLPAEQVTLPRRELQRRLEALRTPPSSPSLPELLHLSAPLFATLQPKGWQKVSWDADRQQLRIEYARPLEPSLQQAAPPGVRVEVQQRQIVVSKKT